MGKLDRKSIRFLLMKYILVGFLTSGILFVFSQMFIYRNFKSVNGSLECYKELDDFYTHVATMNLYAQDYVYKRDEESYQSYEEEKVLVAEELNKINEYVGDDFQWRIGLLENMIDYYSNPLESFLEGDRSNYYETYQQLGYRKELIEGTMAKYYGILTEYFRKETENQKWAWHKSIWIEFAVLIAFLVFGEILSRNYYRKIYIPIHSMTENAERIKEEHYRIPHIRAELSEIKILTETLEEMAASIEKNIEVIKEKNHLEFELVRQENRNLQIQNELVVAQLHSMQAQMNPHFLFNTLGMIAQTAYVQGNEDVYEMMTKLADFLRYALEKIDRNATLHEELVAIKNYIFIQEKRGKGKIKFDIHIEDDLPDVVMPAVIIQPIIENAIIHGAFSMIGESEIILNVEQIENKVQIQVEDDGEGIAPEDLERLLTYIKADGKGSYSGRGSGIGLCNVYKRLNMFYGGNADFLIESEKGCGTIISIELPIEEA